MFGFKLVHEIEISTLNDRVNELRSLHSREIARLDKEMRYWQKRADDERERADGLNDALMQQNGLPTVTAMGKREQAEAVEDFEESMKKYRAGIAEIYADTINDVEDDGLNLPPELQADAERFVADAKAN